MRHVATRPLPPETLTARGLAFWRFVCRQGDGRSMPKRRFDPVEMPAEVLPQLCLFDDVESGTFVCRLYGTGLVDDYGREMTGRPLREFLTGEPQEQLLRLYRDVVAERKIVLSRVELALPRQDLSYDRVIVPLTREDGSVGWVAAFIEILVPMDRRSVLELAAEDWPRQF